MAGGLLKMPESLSHVRLRALISNHLYTMKSGHWLASHLCNSLIEIVEE
jgi:hypothetical protein